MLLPRQTGVITLLVLSLCPTIVVSQTYIRVAICTICSGFFVATGCPAKYDSLFCRIQAFKLNVLNCRTFPCVDFDAPVQNQCVDFPLGCPVQHIKIFGLCQPLKMCCSNKESEGARVSSRQINSWFKLAKQGIRNKRSLKNLLHLNYDGSSYAAPKSNQNEIDASYLNGSRDGLDADFQLLRSSGMLGSVSDGFVPDLPENLDDSVVAEQFIMDEYEKFKQEIFAINDEEMANGMPAILTPGFEDFRAAAQGQKPVKGTT